jgi:hypothetical protein
MAEAAYSMDSRAVIEDMLRDEVAMSEQFRAGAGSILRHLLRNDDRSMFSDEVIARVRGILRDLATQLLTAAQDGAREPGRVSEQAIDQLVMSFVEIPALLSHIHAITLEWQLADQLATRIALDAVLSPLLQARIASPDSDESSVAMLLLTAQARFMQTVRRMELPICELPGDLFHLVLLSLRAHGALDPAVDAAAAAADSALRARYDERRTRLALFEQVLAGMGSEASNALYLQTAGVGFFLTALALGSRQDRDEAAFSTTESQVGKLTLLIAACGLKGDALVSQLAALHPDFDLPDGLDMIRPDTAAAILAEASARTDR